jgi:hypothetical protein
MLCSSLESSVHSNSVGAGGDSGSSEGEPWSNARSASADRVGERRRRCAVHDGVFAQEPGTCAAGHDQLHGLVYPAMAEAIRRAVPQEARSRQTSPGVAGLR